MRNDKAWSEREIRRAYLGGARRFGQRVQPASASSSEGVKNSASAAELRAMSVQWPTEKSSTATAQVGNFAAMRRSSDCAPEPASAAANSPSPGLCPTKATRARAFGSARARANSADAVAS